MSTESVTSRAESGAHRVPAARDRRAGGAGVAVGGRGWIWLLAVGLFALYATISIRRHYTLHTTGYDLGIFEQAVRSYASGNLPTSEIKGPDFPILGDHFSPVLALIAPIYRVFPSATTLLVVQAALLAVAAVPIATTAQRLLGRAAALVVALGYGLSWGIAATVGFDFHEVAFAVPLLAFAACAIVEDRPRAAVLWALPLVAVKEDLGLTLLVVGVLVLWRCRRPVLGGSAALAGVLGFVLAVFLVLPANNPDGRFAYWKNVGGGGSEESGGGLLDLAQRISVGLVDPEPKAILLIVLLAPTAFVALRSPILLLALPTLAWRLLSERWEYSTLEFHYSAVLMPIVFVAFVDGLRRWTGPGHEGRRREALVVSAAVTALLVPSNTFAEAFKPSTWKGEPRVGDSRAVLAEIPDDAIVMASNRLAPHLTNRAEVSVFGWPDARRNPEWIVVDNGEPIGYPLERREAQDALIEQAEEAGYERVEERGDFVLFKRVDPAAEFPPLPEEPAE
ncbi:MAG: DUF2079 domain-containing protein [Sporichthyaceae bacterium]